MSNLVATYVNSLQTLRAKQPVRIRLQNGLVVTAVPEEIEVEKNDGSGEMQQLMQLHIQTDGASGVIEGQLRMTLETYEKVLVKIETMAPRLVAIQHRALGRGGLG